MAIAFTRYMPFAGEEHRSKDARTIGEPFYICVDGLSDIKYRKALRLIMTMLVERADKFVCITASSDMKPLSKPSWMTCRESGQMP